LKMLVGSKLLLPRKQKKDKEEDVVFAKMPSHGEVPSSSSISCVFLFLNEVVFGCGTARSRAAKGK
jgi:hypothetical protein